MTDTKPEAVPEDVRELAARALSNAAVASQNHILDVGHFDADDVLCEAVELACQQAILADRAARDGLLREAAEALSEIGKQRTLSEINAAGAYDDCDFVSGYEECVLRARTALQAISASRNTGGDPT